MIKIKGSKIIKRNKNEVYNNGKNENIETSSNIEVYDFNRGESINLDTSNYVENLKKYAEENKKKKEESPSIYSMFERGESVNLESDISKGETSLKDKDIIKSNIDGGISFTNVQDKNSDDWEGFWGSVSGAASNQLGITNSSISNIANAIKGLNPNSKQSSFDENMSKLDNWKKEKYKELHPFDWKPGQTVPVDLMNNSIASLTRSAINKWGSDSARINQRKFENFISPDPIKYVRDSVKASKGLYGNSPVDQGVFTVKSDHIASSYSASDKSDTVVSVWNKNDKVFSSFNKSPEEIRFINALKNKNTFNKTLGYIYIKPNYNYSNSMSNKDPKGMGEFQIPFEFNPEISEGANQANYVSESLLNRIGQFHIYTGTNLSQLSISLEYIALAPDELDEEQKKNIGKQYSTDSWQYYWTNNRIEEIEYKLRSLVFPDTVSADYLIRPPLIEVHVGNELGAGAEDVGDLYKYPIGVSNSSDDKKYLSVTRSVNGSGSINRYKKYIVTNVQIDALNKDSFVWPSLYGRVWQNGYSGSPINHIKTGKELGSLKEDQIGYSGYTRRTGFKATLQCLEVTENFLDLVPDFKAYYDAWSSKEEMANYTSNYVSNSLNESIEETSDFLDTSINTLKAQGDTIESYLSDYFKNAYSKSKVFKYMNSKSKKAYDYNNSLKEKTDKNNSYYFINSNWPWYSEKASNEVMTTNLLALPEIPENNMLSNENNISNDVEEKLNLNGPIIFNVSLDSNFNSFLNDYFKDDEDGDSRDKKIKDIYSKDADFNEKNANPLNPFSSKIEMGKFYGILSKDKKNDLLNLYNKDENNNKIEKGYSNYIYTKSWTPTKYTDVECYYAEMRIIELSYYIEKKAKEIEFINLEYIKDEINLMYETIINAASEGTYNSQQKKWINKDINFETLIDKDILSLLNEKIDSKAYNTLFSTDRDDSKYEVTLLKDSNELAHWDNMFVAEIQYNLDNDKIDQEKISEIQNFVNDKKLLKMAYYDYNYQKNTLKTFFKDFKCKLKEAKASFKSINILCDDLEKRYVVFLNNLVNGNKYCLNILNANDSYKSSVKEAGLYLSNSLLDGDNFLCLKNKELSVPFEFYSSIQKKKNSSGFVTNNEPSKKKSNTLTMVNKYSTYIYPNELDLLTAREIEDHITKVAELVINEINKLQNELNKIGYKDNDEIFNKINKLSFNKKPSNDKERDSHDNKYANKFKEDHVNNINNIIKLKEFIIELKNKLNENQLQISFSKIVGNYQGSNNYAEIRGLKPLKEKYKDYSKNENSLREEVFKEWDNINTFDSADELVINEDFQTKFQTNSNGEIPNIYFKKYSLEDNIKNMQVAGNSIRNYDKLTSNAE